MTEAGVWYYDEIDTPVGPIVMSMFNEQAIRIDFGTFNEHKHFYETWANKYVEVSSWEQDDQTTKHIKEEIEQYFSGERTTFTFSYVLYGTDFQMAVWGYLFDHIPFGELKTYKDVALGVNSPKAFRAVGGAVNKNPFAIVVPCHRVVGSNGTLVGYGGGLDKKEYLLQLEEAD